MAGSAEGGYSQPGSTVQDQVGQRPDALPFTGADMTPGILGGVLLVVVGLALRKLARA